MAELSPRVLVTGASGFLASHVIHQLLQSEGYRVRGTVRDLTNEKKTSPLQALYPEAKYPLELVQADLLEAESWIRAVKDCDYVIHVASPFPNAPPKNEDEVITPAVEGTKNVLEACANSGSVKRVVITSSVVAIYCGNQDKGYMLTEEDWSVLESCPPYEKSKVLAEQSAWDFVKKLPDEQKFDLVTINPGYMLGPLLHGSSCTSMEIHKRLLQKEMPMLPKLQLALCDVRDVATAHIKSLTLSNAPDNRFIVSAGSMWLREFAQTLDREFKPQGYSIPTKYCPKFGLRVMSLVDKSVKGILPQIGKVVNVSNEKMIKELGITPIEVEKSIIDMAYSLIDQGFVKKTTKYNGSRTNDD
ncbi:tetraketide alpha-pyrone reductase 1-like [Dendronephthya gigantea]|uniref:tetraketide alpha-pyrone reductase 1-like n=1 Tax=Dendronephthya gigantea TaxID=151771 RepID=UPI00106A42C8|nr:tetraketide alpha-pyrone reductase 1-like [Dendronephthya gigantea]